MPNIIKITGPAGPAVIEFDRDRAPAFDEIMVASEIDPRVVLAEARADAERKVREAYEEGLRRGHAAGQQRFEESVGDAALAFTRAAGEMAESRARFMETLEPQLIRLAVLLAQRILEREVKMDPGVIATTARAALAYVLDAERVVLRINPMDLDTMRSRRADLLVQFDRIATIELAADPEIASGGCIASTPALEIDARISEQLASMMKGMLAEASGIPAEQL